MKSMFRALLLLFFLAGAHDVSFAQSVQELGFPSPAAIEVVFSQVAFGSTPYGKLVSEFVVVNASPRDAFVEIDLFDAGGARAYLVYQRETDNMLGVGSDQIRALMPAESITKFSFPPRLLNLVGPMSVFVGWATVRSNGNVTVHENIKLLDRVTREMLTEVSLPGNPRPVLSARFPGILSRSTFTGVSVANPSPTSNLRLKVQLTDPSGAVVRERIVEYPPRTQKSLVLDDILPGPPIVGVQSVRMIPESPGATFAITVLWFQMREGLLDSFIPPAVDKVTSEKSFIIETAQDGWNFPADVTGTARVSDLQIVLTSLGFFLRADDGARLGPFPIFEIKPKIAISQASSLAVVAGPTQTESPEKAIIFAKQRKVVYQRMHGEVDRILDFPAKEQAEIIAWGIVDFGNGIGTVATFLLVDTKKAEVIEKFVGLPGSTPPWRR